MARFKSWLARCNWWGKPEYLAKPDALPQVTGNFLTCLRWDSNLDSGEKQLAFSDNALDRTTIRTGPLYMMRRAGRIYLRISIIVTYGMFVFCPFIIGFMHFILTIYYNLANRKNNISLMRLFSLIDFDLCPEHFENKLLWDAWRFFRHDIIFTQLTKVFYKWPPLTGAMIFLKRGSFLPELNIFRACGNWARSTKLLATRGLGPWKL